MVLENDVDSDSHEVAYIPPRTLDYLAFNYSENVVKWRNQLGVACVRNGNCKDGTVKIRV
jgi:hypothetical protein